MNELETVQTVMMTASEASVIYDQIVSGAREINRLLLRLYNEEGYKALNYENWGQCLADISKDAGIGVKALRRMHKASLMLNSGGRDILEYKEGTIRPIIDTLSDQKGFTDGHRERALELAEEFAGENKVTASIAKSAAQYVAVMSYWGGEVNDDYSLGVAANTLSARMQDGEITTETAYQLMQLMDEDAYGDPRGMEWLIASVSDISLARYLINLRANSSEAYASIEEDIKLSGHMPTKDGQVPINRATYAELVDYLNEPYRMKRYEKAVERTQTYKVVGEKAAAVAVKYWGIHREVPVDVIPESMKEERELYEALLGAGLIKYGVNT